MALAPGLFLCERKPYTRRGATRRGPGDSEKAEHVREKLLLVETGTRYSGGKESDRRARPYREKRIRHIDRPHLVTKNLVPILKSRFFFWNRNFEVSVFCLESHTLTVCGCLCVCVCVCLSLCVWLSVCVWCVSVRICVWQFLVRDLVYDLFFSLTMVSFLNH